MRETLSRPRGRGPLGNGAAQRVRGERPRPVARLAAWIFASGRKLLDYLAWSVPAEVSPDLPQTLDEYRRRREINAEQVAQRGRR